MCLRARSYKKSCSFKCFIKRLVITLGFCLGIFISLATATTQRSLISFANTETEEYLCGAFVKTRSINVDFSGNFKLVLVRVSASWKRLQLSQNNLKSSDIECVQFKFNTARSRRRSVTTSWKNRTYIRIVHPNICWECTLPLAIHDVDEFVSYRNRFGEIQHCITC